MKFKVGDKVRFDEKVGALNTIESGVGVVVGIDYADGWGDDQIYLVHSEDIKLGHSGWGFGAPQDNNQNLWFSDEEIELIEEENKMQFKVGDMVRYKDEDCEGIGKILVDDSERNGILKIDTDEYGGLWFRDDEVFSLTSCDDIKEALKKVKKGWEKLVESINDALTVDGDEEIELIEEDDMEKFKVGDKVRFDDSVYPGYQGIGEIVRVDTDGTVLVKSDDITDGHSGLLSNDYNTNHYWFDIDDVTKLVSFSEFVESLDWDEDYVECNIAHHLGVCDKLNDIYGDKNRDYGNSFGDQFKEHGIISSVIRLDDKMRRFKQITQNGASVEDETVLDTLYDMANYAIMTIMELEGENE